MPWIGPPEVLHFYMPRECHILYYNLLVFISLLIIVYRIRQRDNDHFPVRIVILNFPCPADSFSLS